MYKLEDNLNEILGVEKNDVDVEDFKAPTVRKEDKEKDDTKKKKDNENNDEENNQEDQQDDDDDDSLNVSLAAMEEKLKPTMK